MAFAYSERDEKKVLTSSIPSYTSPHQQYVKKRFKHFQKRFYASAYNLRNGKDSLDLVAFVKRSKTFSALSFHNKFIHQAGKIQRSL